MNKFCRQREQTHEENLFAASNFQTGDSVLRDSLPQQSGAPQIIHRAGFNRETNQDLVPKPANEGEERTAATIIYQPTAATRITYQTTKWEMQQNVRAGTIGTTAGVDYPPATLGHATNTTTDYAATVADCTTTTTLPDTPRLPKLGEYTL